MTGIKRISLLTGVICALMCRTVYPSSGILIIKTDEKDAIHNEIATVRITPKSMILYRGGSMQFIASAYDIKGKKVPFTMHWEVKSDIPDFGSLDLSDGDKVIFNAVNAGTGKLEAVNGNIKAEIPIEIRKPHSSSR